MKKASTIKNYIYNSSYKVLSLLLPLVTAPYLARVLGAERIGIFSYNYAIVYNFTLVAKLGLINYGSRSVAKIRDDKEQLKKVFSEIYLLQIVTTFIALFAYAIFVVFFMNEYKVFGFINAIYILGIGLDIDWLFYGLENFKTVSIRNAIVKVATVVLVLIFVKSRKDLVIYVLIMALSEFLKYASIWMGLKQCTRFVKVSLKKVFLHLKPCLILFIPVIATSVYRTMDKIMLGALTDMTQTGIYENSEKIIYMLLGFVTSLEMVMMPKVSNLIAKGKKEKALDNISKSMVFVVALTVGMAFGIIGISEKFVPWFYGKEFLGCIKLLPLLSITLCAIGWANVIRTQFILPIGRDYIYVRSTLLGAVVNFLVNLIFISRSGAYGAVIGTVVAEFSVAIYLSIVVRKELPILEYLKKTVMFPIFGFAMAIVVWNLGKCISNTVMALVVQIFSGSILYFAMSIIFLRMCHKKLYYDISDRICKIIRKSNDK